MEIEKLREGRRIDKHQPRRYEERQLRLQTNKELKKPFKLTPKFDSYTKFNTKRENIIKEIIHNKLIKPPSKSGTYQDQKYMDKTKHYAFHQKFSHTTNEYVMAKDLLERLARTPNLDDPVVISVSTKDLLIRKVLLDPGSSADVIFLPTFKKMQLNDKVLQPFSGELVRFFGKRVLVTEFAELDPQTDQETRPTPINDLPKVRISNNKSQTTNVVSALSAGYEDQIAKLLQANADLFAWTPADMPGIDPEVVSHRLALYPKAQPVKQKKRHLGQEKTDAAIKETQKLLSVGFISEIHFTSWLVNVVMVKKNSSKWRMCVDFTDLSKACPKDSYPLPCIDKLVDNTSGYKILSFMDAYLGFNQILMHPADEDKTAFIREHENFCYKVMPFGIKNAGATYQHLMDKIFQKQIGRNMEVYVDDMVVKSKNEENHLSDLKEVFEQLRKYNMRLNLEKCTFWVQRGKFLGFLLTHRGIEANPNKCNAVI
ncbi:uncharacterized protein [Arachis hypogaea]|uniref:uncharacterized protein n=1 Tax=Arachis hypogaea TaxID=3818 RepID=UPI003B20BD99